MQTHRHPGLSALLARSLRGLALVAMVGLLAACAGRAPGPPLGPQTAEPVTVIVQRGDTLLGIARRHGVSLSPLAAANGLGPPYLIRPGQVLHVPVSGAPLAPAVAGAPSGSSLGFASPIDEPPPTTAALPAARPEGPASRAVVAEALPPPGPPQPASPIQEAASTQPAATMASAEAARPATRAVAEREREGPAAAERERSGPAAAERERFGPAPAERERSGQAAAERERSTPREAGPPPRRMAPGRFLWPVRGRVVSGFGSKGGGLVNDGMNIAAPEGTPVRAGADGTVIYAGNGVRGFGNLVLIRHQGGWVTAYAHNERILVRQGQAVRTGEEIARVGSTGAVASPQLHFQVRRDGKPVDPAAHLDRAVAGR